MKLRVSIAARNDLAQAVSWYENQADHLGMDLLSEIKSMLRVIQRNPLIYACMEDDFRKAPLKRFSYHIIYRIISNEIQVAAIFHMRRNPEQWQKRLT